MRSKAAKIVLWVLLGLVIATLLVMGIVVLIDACGGTGTTHYGLMPTLQGFLIFFIIILVMAYLLTEPSFKKKIVEEEIDTKPQYVKKAKQPRPTAPSAAGKNEPKEKKDNDDNL